ncbi:hypothetical protein [Synechococcus sp. CB0101]|uniref:hypothetical protein n=1 Tax=Synechococcus sp. CB0101 TaxID=232348 RepID=UPI00143D077E|nr:hypothetical protein [Synechococcus sp. CB0101]
MITEFTQQQPATKLMLPWPVFTNMVFPSNQANLTLDKRLQVATRTFCGGFA